MRGALSPTPSAKPLSRFAGSQSGSNSCLVGPIKSRAGPQSRNGSKVGLGSQGVTGPCTWHRSGREPGTERGYTVRTKKVLWHGLPAAPTKGWVEGWKSQGVGATWTAVTRKNTLPTSLHYLRPSELSCD